MKWSRILVQFGSELGTLALTTAQFASHATCFDFPFFVDEALICPQAAILFQKSDQVAGGGNKTVIS